MNTINSDITWLYLVDENHLKSYYPEVEISDIDNFIKTKDALTFEVKWEIFMLLTKFSPFEIKTMLNKLGYLYPSQDSKSLILRTKKWKIFYVSTNYLPELLNKFVEYKNYLDKN